MAIHRARRLLVQTLPLFEVLPATGDRTDLRLLAAAEHNDGIMVEQVRNSVEVVGEVLLECSLEIIMDVLALDKQQRQS